MASGVEVAESLLYKRLSIYEWYICKKKKNSNFHSFFLFPFSFYFDMVFSSVHSFSIPCIHALVHSGVHSSIHSSTCSVPAIRSWCRLTWNQALGMSLPYSSSTPADDPMKKDECHKAAAAVRNMLEKVGCDNVYTGQTCTNVLYIGDRQCFRGR